MKILSNKKYNDLISKQFRGIFADVNDDNLLRENGLLYGENKELKQEIERLNNIINELSKENQELKEKTKLFHKNGVFSLEYDKETLRDMVLEYQEKIDKAIEYIRIYRSYQKIDNKDYLKGRDEIGCLDIYQVDELLDILKEVS